jgi:hypothetical protein
MDPVTLVLDRERMLRYEWTDLKEICRILSRLQPGDSPDKVTQNRLWQLLAERDPDATTLTLFHGLKRDDQRLWADKIDEIIGDFVRQGGDMDTVYDAIVDAMVAAGLVKLPNRNPRDNGASGNGTRAMGS